MGEIKSLAEAYLTAERNLVTAVESAGGAVPLPDGRTVTVGRAEFDALRGERRNSATFTTVAFDDSSLKWLEINT
jgi:hypothetical protein